MTRRWARISFWAACIGVMFAIVASVVTGLTGRWVLYGVDCGLVGGLFVSARIFRRQIGRLTTPNHPVASRHDQCLANIDVLERQLADDGVLFLKTPEDFDREVAKILPRPKPVLARNVNAKLGPVTASPKSIPQGLSPKKLCPVSGMQYGTCPCDPRWASLRQCPAHRTY